jgi:glutathione S-transferase
MRVVLGAKMLGKKPDPEALAFVVPRVAPVLELLEDMLKTKGTDFLTGAHVTIADL